ncbi:hypothetical protein G5C51_28720 [Streptomyces sp. A7024]|uniref:Uncharacterized protein n=1 Tax=Streptomyces coryli TaxID=1128680 RepID=A0A6G4U9K6_9ACTN|nr:hypothetical protein [Streptomyces coryli]NGN67871.1 hypothetical protein [Streptomyces coryli]
MNLMTGTTSPAYLRRVRASAWYDLVVTAGFATPWTYELLHGTLGLLGGTVPALDPMQVLYANLMGSVVLIWATLRLTGTRPEHGLYDGVARLLFSTWFLYALTQGAPSVLWVFLVVELPFGVVQLAPWVVNAVRRPVAAR